MFDSCIRTFCFRKTVAMFHSCIRMPIFLFYTEHTRKETRKLYYKKITASHLLQKNYMFKLDLLGLKCNYRNTGNFMFPSRSMLEYFQKYRNPNK